MSRKASSSAMTNRTIAQQTQSHSTASLFKFNQLTCGILAASALLFAAPGWAASPTAITNQANATGTDDIALAEAADEQVINNAAADAITLEKKITGKGKVTKKNDGTVTLNITGSTYEGETQIQNGVLKAGKDNVLSPNSSINLSKETVSGTDKFGTLDLNNTTQTIKGLKGLQGTRLKLGTGTLNINFDNTLADQTFRGVIEGEAGSNLNKKGNGILELGAQNSYQGLITIEAGELKASTDANDVISHSKGLKLAVATAKFNLNNTNQTVGKLTGMGAVELGTGNLTINYAKPGEGETAPAPADITFSGPINGTGGLTKAGTGKLILSGAGKAYTGVTTISGGTLQFNAVPTMTASVTNNANLVFSIGAGTGDLPKVISGTGSVEKMGDGELVLVAANTYEGKTTISGGKLKAGIANAFSAKSDVDVKSGATLILGAFGDQGIGTLSGAGTVDLKAVNLTINSKADSEFSGKITGTGGLTLDKAMGQTSGHVLTLSGTGENANDYSGLTTITAGTLKLGAANAIATSSGVNISATGILDLGGFDQNIKALEGAAGGEIHLGDKALTTTLDAAKSFAGVIKGAGGSLTKAGNAVLTLSGANEYTGITTISGGTLKTDNAKALGTSAVNITTATAVLELGTSDLTIGALTGIAGSTVKLGTHTLTAEFAAPADSQPATGEFLGKIESSMGAGAGGLTKKGTGILTLGGANTYEGATRIEAGTLKLAAMGSIANSSGVNVLAGGTLEVNGEKTIKMLEGAAGSHIVLADGSTLKTSFTAAIAAGEKTFSGNITGAGGLSKEGDGVLVLGTAGANDYRGATTITAGTLKAGAAQAFSANSNVIIGATGTLDLANNNQKIAALSSSAGAEGGTVQLGTATLITSFNKPTEGADTPATFKGVIAGTTGGLTKEGTGTLILTKAATYAGATTVSGGTLQLDAIPTMTSGITVGTDATLAINNTGNMSFDVSKIAGPSGTFKKTGAGELTLHGTASEFKGTTLVEAGTLKFGIADALAGSVLDISGKMADAAEGTPTPTVNFSGFDQSFAGLQGDGQVIMGANNITLNTSAATPFTFNGTITGTGTVTKAGEGTQIFNSADNSTGAVTVNTGTLLIGGASTNSNASFTSTGITVANTGTLGGYGTISAPVTVESGGILSPGTDTAVGTLTVNNQNLTFKKGSVLNYTVTDSAAANNADLVKVTGTGKVTIEEGSVLNIMTVPGAVRFIGNNSYTVIDSASPIDKSGSGFMAKLPDNPLLTVTGVQYGTNKVTLSVTPGPVVADDQGSSTTETKVVNEFGGTPGSKTDVPLPLTINVPAGEDHSVTTPRTGTNALTGNRDQTGTGKLVLNSDVELKQGVWNVSEGTLQVGGDGHPQVRFTGDIDVKNGTTLEGFGSISGTVHVREGGTLAPGGSAGLMSITNPVLDAKSNFDIDIRPVTKQNEFGFINDTLKVSDTGSIAEGTNLVLKVELPEDNAWKNDHEYKVLDATASGADIVKDDLFSINDDEVKEKLNFLTREPLIYDKRNKTVTLRLSLKPQFDNRITRFVENGKGNLNQLSIAESLRTTSHFEGLYRTLLSFNTAAGGSLEVGIPAALSNLAPEIYASASDSLLQNSHYVRDAVLQNYRADNQVWISTWGHGGRSQGDSQYTSSSVSNQGWGVALGSDVLMAQNFSAGLMAGFERTTVNGNDASSGKARINAAHLGAYLHADLNQVNLSGGLIYSLLDQKAERRIDIPGIGMQGKLSNDNSGHQIQLFAELNRDFHMATSSTLTPYVNLAHVWQSMGAGTEKALGTAEPAALRLDKDHKGVTFTGLGLRGTLTLPTAAPASLYFAAGWQHAFGDTNSGISSYFNGATEQAVTHGTGLAKDSALINTGLNIQVGKSSTLNVSYQGEFGSGHTDNAGKIQWQMRF